MNTIMILMFLLTLDCMANADGICESPFTLFTHEDGTPDCLFCHDCQNGTIKTKECPPHDTECTRCYRSTQNKEDGNQSCNLCRTCEPGSYVETNCTKFDDTVCTTCPNGTFSAKQNADRCSECGNCTGEMITKAECSNSTDVVCMRKEVPLETTAVIAIVAAVLESIATIIIVVMTIITHRKMLKKRRSGSTPERQEMIPVVQSQGRDTAKDKIMLNDFKTSVGVLVVNGNRQQGPRSQVQTRPIIVLRIGKDLGITALQALKRKISQIEHKTDFTKLQADNVFIEFHAHENVIKYRISSNTPVFADVDLDIVILKIKQHDSEPSSIHDTPVLKLNSSDRVKKSDMQILDCKAKPSNGKGRNFNEKTVSLSYGFEVAMKILEHVLGEAMLEYIQVENKGDLDISINELGRNIYTKDSEQLKNISENLRNNEKLNEIINNPADPEDVTTIFVRGDYSSGCPGYTYDDSGNLQVHCILTHRVPKILDVINENDQKRYFGCIQNVTAGTKITAIYKALKKANQKSLIKAVFESENKS